MKENQDEPKSMLIVDDDPFLQGLFRKTLERAGFKTMSAVDGLAAVKMLPNLSADLIVLDLMLPKLHGLKVLEAIRADNRHKNLPVLILSNAYLPELARKAMEAGATKGMLKSECSPARLLEVIREVLENKSPGANGSKPTASRKSLLGRLMGAMSKGSDSGTGSLAKAAEIAASAKVQRDLEKGWQVDLAAIRQHCLGYIKSVGTQESQKNLEDLYRSLRFLSARAAMGKCGKVSQLSPLTIMKGVTALDLRVAIETKGARSAVMNVRAALSSENNVQDLLARLTSVTMAASALQTGAFDEAELGLAAGWQLAQAMGAQITIEGEGNREACLVLSLPLETDAQLSSVNEPAASSPSVKGNGNGKSKEPARQGQAVPNTTSDRG